MPTQPTPPSTASSTGGHSPENADGQYKIVRKRNRVPLSCSSCRSRKLKCDRKNPSCDNCTKRGDGAQCTYAAPGVRKKSTAASQNSGAPDEMQSRINRLESLVLSLMTNGQGSAGPVAAAQVLSSTSSSESPVSMRHNPMQDDGTIKEEGENGSDTEAVTNRFGVLRMDNDKKKSMYVGESHWHLVLKDIEEVKNYFASHPREVDAQYVKIAQSIPVTAQGGPPLLFGAHTPATEQELKTALPSQATVEKLVDRFFTSNDSALMALHYSTFHRQVTEHFRDPSPTSMVWIALLYAVLCIAMQTYHNIGDEPPEWKDRTLSLAREFKLRAVQALVQSDYTNPVEYTIEALVLYAQGEFSSRWDADVGMWTLIGTIIRLSERLGYHRDPKHFSTLSPFKGEMRRRVWGFLRMCDIMFSFQLALPSMLSNKDCNTETPGNYFEDQLSEDMKELPEERPASEATPISYILSKTRLSLAFSDVVDGSSALGTSPSYDEIMRMDHVLREARTSLPPHLRLRPLEDSLHDPAKLLMARYNLDILYQKSICVLHRKYLTRARTNPRYAHSRRACVEAGLEILHHQAVLHRESQIGGRMRSMKWLINKVTKHDYLLGAMIVCLDLNYDSVARPFDHDRYFWTEEHKRDMLQALETSEAIWALSTETSMEAWKASRILTIMLEKVRNTKEAGSRPSQQETRTKDEVFSSFDDNQPEHSAAITLGMLSAGGLTPNTAAMFANMATIPNGRNVDMYMPDAQMSTGMTPYMTDPNSMDNNLPNPFTQVFGSMPGMTGMVDMPSNLDWEAWDSYVQHGNTLDPALQFGTYNMSGYGDSMLDSSNVNINVSNNGTDPNTYDNNVFMGANTPGRM